MKKWLLIGGVVVIILIIFLVVGVSNLGPLIKNAVNTYGPKITKTEMRLADVGISIFSGEAKLNVNLVKSLVIFLFFLNAIMLYISSI